LTVTDVSKCLHNQWEQLEVHEGIVYKQTEAKSGEPNYVQLLVPRRLIPEVIHSVHGKSTGGRLGINQMLEQVKRRFYWPSWKADARYHSVLQTLPRMQRMSHWPISVANIYLFLNSTIIALTNTVTNGDRQSLQQGRLSPRGHGASPKMAGWVPQIFDYNAP